MLSVNAVADGVEERGELGVLSRVLNADSDDDGVEEESGQQDEVVDRVWLPVAVGWDRVVEIG